jgi:hypothetical protein
LLFIYALGQDVTPPGDLGDLWTWHGRRYLLRGITAEDYRQHLRVRSPRWGTVHIPSATFRQLARPLHFFTHEYHPSAEECPF